MVHADKVVSEIGHVDNLLGRFAEFWTQRDDVVAGLRSARAHRYVIFYRVTEEVVEIVRVLDERRDVDANFENPDVGGRRSSSLPVGAVDIHFCVVTFKTAVAADG